MGKGDDCDKPGCKNRKEVVDSLVRFYYGEQRRSIGSNLFGFARMSDSGTIPSEAVIHEKLEETVVKLGKPLVELTIEDLDGNLDLEKIAQAKFQSQKISIDLERLEILLRESELPADERQDVAKEIANDLQHEIERLLSLILQD